MRLSLGSELCVVRVVTKDIQFALLNKRNLYQVRGREGGREAEGKSD